MSDLTSSVFTIANAFTSPKAIIKFLSIALFLIITWVYVYPPLSELNIPTEHLSIIVLFIGIGLGSLVGSIISLIYNYVFNKYEKNKQEKSDLKTQEANVRRDKELKKVSDEKVANRLKNSIEFLNGEDRNTLYLLTQTNTTIDHIERQKNVLLDNQYIHMISRVDKNRVLVKLNPALFDIVSAHFEQYKQLEFNFFMDTNKHAEKLLDLLDVNNAESTELVDMNVLQSTRYGRQIKGELHPNSGYWLYFERFMFEGFEQHSERKYSEEFFIPISRIITSST